MYYESVLLKVNTNKYNCENKESLKKRFCEAYIYKADDRDVHVLILDLDAHRLRNITQFLIDSRLDRKTISRYSYVQGLHSLFRIGSIFQS